MRDTFQRHHSIRLEDWISLHHVLDENTHSLFDIGHFVLQSGQLLAKRSHSNRLVFGDTLLRNHLSEHGVDLHHTPETLIPLEQVN
jgi:hypothetical protein